MSVLSAVCCSCVSLFDVAFENGLYPDWRAKFVFINNQLTFMLYYSYISNKTENSVLGDDAICI